MNGENTMRLSKNALALAGLAFAAAGVISLNATTAFAHHSASMFENQKNVELEGTVKEFQFTQPHIWVQLLVPDSAGKLIEWSIEGGSPSQLGRKGWRRSTLNPGDKIKLTMHPLKDGRPGGSLVSIILNGKDITS